MKRYFKLSLLTQGYKILSRLENLRAYCVSLKAKICSQLFPADLVSKRNNA